MAKRFERLRRTRDQYPPIKPENPEKLTEEEMDAVLLEVLQISKPCARLAAKIFRFPDIYATIVDDIHQPGIARYVEENIDFSHIVRFGHYSKVLATVAEFRREVRKFLQNPEQLRSAALDVRNPTKDDIATYVRRLRNFESVADLVIKDSASYVGAWLSWKPRLEDISSDNAYLADVEAGSSVGEILLSVARELPHASLAKGHSFDSVQYTDVMEILYSVIRQEAAESFPTIYATEEIDQEKLSKVLFDLIAAFEYHLPTEVRSVLTSPLRSAYSDGVPMYRVLFGLMRQFTDALVHDKHIGHQVTWKLVDVLNSFRLAAKSYDSELSEHMFNFLLGAGQIQLEFSGMGDYQEFIVLLEKLATKESPYQQRYQNLLDFMIRSSTHFPHKVMVTGAHLSEELFDIKRITHYSFDFAERVRDIFKAGQYEVMELTLNERVTPISETSLRGEKYDTIMLIRRFADDRYVIDMMTTTVQDRPVVHELGYRLDMRRFRCQIFLEDGRVSTVIPVAQQEQMHPEIESAIIQHAKLLVGLVDIEEVREQTLRELQSEAGPLSPQDQSPWSSDREQRKASYEASRSQRQDPVQPERKVASVKQDQGDADSTESEQFALYVPHELVLSVSLREEMKKAGKKGARSKVLQDTSKFFSRYNAQSDFKPGKGIPMTAVTGPNGERIWRFYVNYDVRCIAVELGSGKAMVVMTDDHDGAYKDYDKIARVVAQALDKYQGE